MIAVHHVLRGDAFLLGADGDGHSVFVGAADEDYIFLFSVAGSGHKCRQEHKRLPGVRYEPGRWHTAMPRSRCTFEFLFHCVIMYLFLL